MAGLLDGVLPYLYSQSDRMKRHVGGLLSDPMGTMEQTTGGLLDSHRAQQGLLGQAFANPKRPFQVTDKNAMMQAAQNMLNGPLGMAPAGITAWHGSPHVFDKFDHAGNLGKGDGSQMQGIGTYLAENPEVASTYAKRGGNIYKVDLPDEVVPKMLDFGLPIMQQRHLGEQLNSIHHKDPSLRERMFASVKAGESGEMLFSTIQEKYARDLKQSGFAGDVFDESNRMATKAFKDAGLAGFKYPDKGSRGGSGGTSNFVIFDDGALSVLERNGQPLR